MCDGCGGSHRRRETHVYCGSTLAVKDTVPWKVDAIDAHRAAGQHDVVRTVKGARETGKASRSVVNDAHLEGVMMSDNETLGAATRELHLHENVQVDIFHNFEYESLPSVDPSVEP